MFRKLIHRWIAAAFVAGPTLGLAAIGASAAAQTIASPSAERAGAASKTVPAPQPGGAAESSRLRPVSSANQSNPRANATAPVSQSGEPASLLRTIRTLAPVRDPPRTFQVLPKNARQLRVEGVVLQERDFSCGAAALATVLQYQWGGKESETDILLTLLRNMTPDEVRDRVKNGLSLTDLRRAAASFGYQTVIGRLPLDKLSESKIPLIVGITVRGYDHFCVLRGVDDEFVYLADPAIGRHRVLIEDFERQWQRNAVLVVLRPGADVSVSSPFMATEEERSLGAVNRRFLQSQVVPRGYR